LWVAYWVKRELGEEQREELLVGNENKSFDFGGLNGDMFTHIDGSFDEFGDRMVPDVRERRWVTLGDKRASNVFIDNSRRGHGAGKERKVGKFKQFRKRICGGIIRRKIKRKFRYIGWPAIVIYEEIEHIGDTNLGYRKIEKVI